MGQAMHVLFSVGNKAECQGIKGSISVALGSGDGTKVEQWRGRKSGQFLKRREGAKSSKWK